MFELSCGDLLSFSVIILLELSQRILQSHTIKFCMPQLPCGIICEFIRFNQLFKLFCGDVLGSVSNRLFKLSLRFLYGDHRNN